MIVIAAPRCGGTVFTMDMSKKHNVEFVGQVHSPKYVETYYKTKRNNEKVLIHETQSQPVFTEEQYFDIMINHQKYGILANGVDNTLLLHQADYLLLRKNLFNIFASLDKYFKKIASSFNNPNAVDPERVKWDFVMRLNAIYNICLYAKKSNKKITWYEDFYHTPDYELTEDLFHKLHFIKNTNVEELFIEMGGIALPF